MDFEWYNIYNIFMYGHISIFYDLIGFFILNYSKQWIEEIVKIRPHEFTADELIFQTGFVTFDTI